MTPHAYGHVEALQPAECAELLAGAQFGRVAVTMGALPAIFPVLYRWVGGEITFLTGPGTKLTAALSEAVVAFEVDEFDPAAVAGWSVQAVGIARAAVRPYPGQVPELDSLPWAADDRPCVVRIRPEYLSGRRLVPGLAKAPPRQ